MKNFKAQSAIQEVIAAIGTLIILGIIVYAFYTIPSPIRSTFRGMINEFIIGIIIVGIAAVILYFLLRSRS